MLRIFIRSEYLSALIKILGDFCKAKFIWGISLIFSIVIWSLVTSFFTWHQKDEWNSLENSWAPYAIGKAFAIRHNGQKEKKNFLALFYRWGSTASRLEPVRGGSLLFATKFPDIPGTHFIDPGWMIGWVDPGATQWFWTWDTWKW